MLDTAKFKANPIKKTDNLRLSVVAKNQQILLIKSSVRMYKRNSSIQRLIQRSLAAGSTNLSSKRWILNRNNRIGKINKSLTKRHDISGSLNKAKDKNTSLPYRFGGCSLGSPKNLISFSIRDLGVLWTALVLQNLERQFITTL